KIMTAVVALEHKNLDEEIIISPQASEIGENVMGISAGEVYTLEEMLYGLMLNSGNDAAYAIAEGVAGDVDTFVKWMNIKAEEINLSDSFFGGPSGLYGGTYSTAIDLVKLSYYAMKKETFREIVKTYELEFPYSEKHKYIYLWNQTNLLTTYPGVAGIKTGYTEDAGLCLVTYAENEGRELIGVILNSIDRKGDMILVLDYGFQLLGVTVEHHLLDY
ncbi:MAG: D-alanyl-D-alanine carboxypeptidase, partial [Patescibacteria group bacterium]